jgi:hypothetical protein
MISKSSLPAVPKRVLVLAHSFHEYLEYVADKDKSQYQYATSEYPFHGISSAYWRIVALPRWFENPKYDGYKFTCALEQCRIPIEQPDS